MDRHSKPDHPAGCGSRGRPLIRARMGARARILVAFLATLAVAMASVSPRLSGAPSVGAQTVGQDFVVTPSDLAFILKQIKIAEFHVANTTSLTGPCGALVGPGQDQIGSPLLSFGLRTVDGSCNNLQPGQETYGASDQTFPRLTTPVFRPAESNPPLFGPPAPTSYAQTSGNVFDSQPRLVSNLIVDQTSTNPAAIAAAGFPVRTQGNPGSFPCTIDPDPNAVPPVEGFPVGCVPSHSTLDIPNVTTDVGLSPPFNALFTIFGQFFDHGLDKITNGGSGTVFVPLQADDPLVAGPDHIFGNADDLPPTLRFMVLTRGTIVTGPDGFRNAPNTDTPFVDQSQTYTSHPSHQVFDREYVDNSAGRPVTSGQMLASPDGGLPTWAMVKAQAATMLGLQLVDQDVHNIPMVAADPYGKFIPGPLRGLPQYVTASGLVEGNRAAPVAAPADVVRIETAFLNDIAHAAAPCPGCAPDGDTVAGGSLDPVAPGTYDNELLDLHFICGDGRCNENIALSAIHQVFHSEHDRLVGYIKSVLLTDTSGITTLADWQTALGAPDAGGTWNGERLFQAARFVTEMEYQHLVFEEFARKVQPLINPFQPFAFNQTDVNPAITAEFAHAVYRFGHSMLTDTISRTNADGSHNDIPLLDGFLNPGAFHDGGSAGVLSSQAAAGAILMGMSDQTGQEIDEFVTETLRNHLLGLPLDLPSINMARARSEGIPSLNNARRQIFNATNDGQLTPYPSWVGFGQALKHPESLVNFVAAYGKHPAIVAETTLVGKRTTADRIVNGTILPGPDGILGANPATALDDTPAVPAGPGPDGLFGTNCGTPTPSPECADNTPAVPAGPGPDGILGPDPSTALDDVNPPLDSADFMFSTGAWANTGTTSITGLDDVDLWVGGLAERTNLFGGLLGSTFNYVFENQLTNLQNGDRLYYLARTPGMNLRAQLEGNSFAELVMRNTPAHTLKADPFATADCKFELGRLTFPAVAGSFITGAGSVNDDPLSECNENRLLLRMPDGQFRYRAINSVDPPGINGQSVYNGTAGPDRIFGGNDTDTFWGGPGNDIIEGNDGADIALGGEGNDIITDLAGDDILKGGPGNDAIDAGPGLDIILGGDGKDFTNGGANINETFGGPGDDFMIAGQGEDAIFGDSGDDWEEGGDQPDLLIGDSSSLFFDDHNLPGHDILIGQGGDDDYDGEGGDDIFVAGPGIEKNAGAAGYDWSIGLWDPQPQDADLALPIIALPLPLNGVRDRFNEVEALSGWNFDDVLHGDDIVPAARAGGGFIGCDVLDAAGVARIAGLEALVPASIRTLPAGPIIAASATQHCDISGLVWGAGNILLGGAGSDILEGRGGDDILDGDRYLSVRLSIRTNPNDPLSEIGTTDLMEHAALGGTFGAGTAGMTLQQAVFAGLVDPGNIVAVREILDPGPAGAIDTAYFSGPEADYVITVNPNGSITVTDLGGAGGGGGNRVNDGVDTLWNIERLSFCVIPGAIRGTCDLRTDTVDPVADVLPASLDFGSVTVGTTSISQAIDVTNSGAATLIVSSVVLTGPNAAAFAITGNTCDLVPPATTCTISVTFNPTATGPQTASVDITHNASGTASSVALSGTGLAAGPATGLLRVTTSPGLPAQVLVNGLPMDDWALNWVKLPPGTYTVSFSDLIGFITPAPQAVTVVANQTTTVQGTFVQKGNLRVVTSPPVPSTITVDGVPMNDWGMWTDLPVGSYQVCFGAVADWNTPACQTAVLTAGVTTVITGTFTANAGAPGAAAGFGLLRVQTSPAVPSQILVNGIPRTDWGLDWVKLPPGTYTVSFGGVKDMTAPAPQVVTVTAGNTTVVTGTFIVRGWLRAVTSPAVPATISVDGVPRDDWGMWTSFEPGTYQVCFGSVSGFTGTPVCQTQPVTAGLLTTVTGTYTP